jgi:hypothetical protein
MSVREAKGAGISLVWCGVQVERSLREWGACLVDWLRLGPRSPAGEVSAGALFFGGMWRDPGSCRRGLRVEDEITRINDVRS